MSGAASAAIKRDGRLRSEDYENEGYYSLLEKVLKQLHDELPDAKYDKKTLAQLLWSVQQFMEDSMGKNAIIPKPGVKLPAHIFWDFEPDGAVFYIAKRCHHWRQQLGLKKIDWFHPGKRNENNGFIRLLRSELEQRRVLRPSVVFIHPSCGADMLPRLKSIVDKMGGVVAHSDHQSGLTHAVYPFGPKGDPDDGQHYMRNIGTLGGKILVHHWYLPDSYNELLNFDVAPEEQQLDREPIGPWKVYVRWLLDSEVYNEWMNPNDYETEDFQKEQEEMKAKGITGGEEGEEGEEAAGGVPSAKRRKRYNPLQPEVQAGAGEPLGPAATKQQLLQVVPAVVDGSATVEDVSLGQQRVPPGAKPQAPRAPAPPEQQQQQQQQQQAAGARAARPDTFLVPCSTSWFSWNGTSQVERLGVPEFFSGQYPGKTPKLYKQYRDALISKYREEPLRRLTLSLAREVAPGDVLGVQRVWQFLDQHGLINFQARDNPDNDPDVAKRIASLDTITIIQQAFNAPEASALFNFKLPSVAQGAAAAGQGGTLLGAASRGAGHTGRGARQGLVPRAQHFCNAMPWVDCSALRYHCTRYPDIDLCPQAFAEGRFPPGCSAKDFVRIEGRAQLPDPDGWTPEETLLLLEALEVCGDNWAEVAEHVGSKTQLECAMRFLQLPTEDTFADELLERPPSYAQVPGRPAAAATGGAAAAGPAAAGPAGGAAAEAARPSAGAAGQQQQQQQSIPFADTGNPLMAQLALLATLVGPKVAAAAAQRALEVLAQEDSEAAQELAAAPGAAGAAAGAGGAEPVQEGGEAREGGDGAAAAAAAGAPAAGAPGASEQGEEELPPQQQLLQGLGAVPITKAKMAAAAAAALAAAAAKAKLLADHEEREIQRLVVQAVDTQLRKVEAKLKYADDMMKALNTERMSLAASRRQLDVERQKLAEERAKLKGTGAAVQPAVGPART